MAFAAWSPSRHAVLFLIRLRSDPGVSVIGIALSPLGAMAEPLGSRAPRALSVAGERLLGHSLQQSFQKVAHLGDLSSAQLRFRCGCK